MIFFLILGVLIGSLTVVFALQNVVNITVNFLVWQIDGSLSLILLLAVLAGVLICALVSIPEVISNMINVSALKKVNKQLEDENLNYKKIAEASNRIANQATQNSSDNLI